MKKATTKPHVVASFLLRAPALPTEAWRRGRGGAAAEAALALAAPGLPAGAAARRRYLARMAFRTAPAGLLAGVAVGRLGARTRVATGGAGTAHLDLAWPRLRALARALLDEPEVREQVSLRRAPSLVSDGETALWLSRDAQVERAPVDEPLAAALAAADGWAPWPAVRAALAVDEAAADDLLLQLCDAGLLHDDLTPPLVGPPPSSRWLLARLARLDPPPPCAAALAALLDEVAPSEADSPSLPARIRRLQAAVEALPGAAAGRPLAGVLALAPTAATLSRAAVERAAGLAPLLFRLAAALAGPTWERATGPALDEAVAALLEDNEPGAFDAAGLALGRFGVALDEAAPALADGLPPLAPSPPAYAPPAPLARLLLEKLANSADAVALTVEELAAALPPAPLPPSFELVLAPAREAPRARPGTGWLLGLHGPAGATWGRFASALGAPLARAFDELFAAEAAALPGARRVDVTFAPDAVADVAAHPPLREAALALSSWPAGEAVAAAELALDLGAPLALDGVSGAPDALGLRDGAGRPLVPLPLHRVRGTAVADEGLHRLLAGFALQRASAPWALPWAALAGARTPRVTVEGFVVAPASWRIPREALAGRAALARWREAAAVPRRVQVGFEDQLLPVDLDASDARETIAALADGERLPRAWEIWPPLDGGVDADGRRVEAVVAVVAGPAPEPPPPRRVAPPAPAPGWTTVKLYGPPDRADRLLVETVRPAAGARWFFQRYLDGPRHHLRVRVGGDPAPLRAAARAAAGVVAVETAGYFREPHRFGGAPMAAIEAAFQSDSELVCDLAALDPSLRPPGGDLLARSFDALARGAGLALDERRALAAACRARLADLITDEAGGDPLAPLYRARQRDLVAALAGVDDAAAPAFAAHLARLAALPLDRAQWAASLPSLLHLAAVRLVGPGAAREAVGCYLWERALESLARRSDHRR